MKLDKIELVLMKLPYVHYFETSFGREVDRTFILVKATTQGLTGYGEVVASQNPFYSYETSSTAWLMLKDYLIPFVKEQGIIDPKDFAEKTRRFKGHPMAKAGLELALWDLLGKREGRPLSDIYGGIRTNIDAGVSVGIQDSASQLLDRIQGFLDQGYQRIKIKIKPGWDDSICKAIRKNFPHILLQADANGAYSLKDSNDLKRLDEFKLLMLEQPFPAYDLWDHSRLQNIMETDICLDESITSEVTARTALEMKSCRVVNIKVGRVGGIVEARRIHDTCLKHGIPVWCGGMLESGIGRAHNLHLASLENFVLPNDLSASDRYYAEDIVCPSFRLDGKGTIAVPQGPGIGVDPVEERIARATVFSETFTC